LLSEDGGVVVLKDRAPASTELMEGSWKEVQYEVAVVMGKVVSWSMSKEAGAIMKFYETSGSYFTVFIHITRPA
jgi:hypothetical protein